MSKLSFSVYTIALAGILLGFCAAESHAQNTNMTQQYQADIRASSKVNDFLYATRVIGDSYQMLGSALTVGGAIAFFSGAGAPVSPALLTLGGGMVAGGYILSKTASFFETPKPQVQSLLIQKAKYQSPKELGQLRKLIQQRKKLVDRKPGSQQIKAKDRELSKTLEIIANKGKGPNQLLYAINLYNSVKINDLKKSTNQIKLSLEDIDKKLKVIFENQVNQQGFIATFETRLAKQQNIANFKQTLQHARSAANLLVMIVGLSDEQAARDLECGLQAGITVVAVSAAIALKMTSALGGPIGIALMLGTTAAQVISYMMNRGVKPANIQMLNRIIVGMRRIQIQMREQFKFTHKKLDHIIGLLHTIETSGKIDRKNISDTIVGFLGDYNRDRLKDILAKGRTLIKKCMLISTIGPLRYNDCFLELHSFAEVFSTDRLIAGRRVSVESLVVTDSLLKKLQGYPLLNVNEILSRTGYTMSEVINPVAFEQVITVFYNFRKKWKRKPGYSDLSTWDKKLYNLLESYKNAEAHLQNNETFNVLFQKYEQTLTQLQSILDQKYYHVLKDILGHRQRRWEEAQTFLSEHIKRYSLFPHPVNQDAVYIKLQSMKSEAKWESKRTIAELDQLLLALWNKSSEKKEVVHPDKAFALIGPCEEAGKSYQPFKLLLTMTQMLESIPKNKRTRQMKEALKSANVCHTIRKVGDIWNTFIFTNVLGTILKKRYICTNKNKSNGSYTYNNCFNKLDHINILRGEVKLENRLLFHMKNACHAPFRGGTSVEEVFLTNSFGLPTTYYFLEWDRFFFLVIPTTNENLFNTCRWTQAKKQVDLTLQDILHQNELTRNLLHITEDAEIKQIFRKATYYRLLIASAASIGLRQYKYRSRAIAVFLSNWSKKHMWDGVKIKNELIKSTPGLRASVIQDAKLVATKMKAELHSLLQVVREKPHPLQKYLSQLSAPQVQLAHSQRLTKPDASRKPDNSRRKKQSYLLLFLTLIPLMFLLIAFVWVRSKKSGLG